VIPIKAVVLNLLSVGAAYGVLVLVFQHTWAEELLNFHSSGADRRHNHPGHPAPGVAPASAGAGRSLRRP
jgi:uncharacterized membrane protein YdfJ with MMPL/SSD domain